MNKILTLDEIKGIAEKNPSNQDIGVNDVLLLLTQIFRNKPSSSQKEDLMKRGYRGELFGYEVHKGEVIDYIKNQWNVFYSPELRNLIPKQFDILRKNRLIIDSHEWDCGRLCVYHSLGYTPYVPLFDNSVELSEKIQEIKSERMPERFFLDFRQPMLKGIRSDKDIIENPSVPYWSIE